MRNAICEDDSKESGNKCAGTAGDGERDAIEGTESFGGGRNIIEG